MCIREQQTSSFTPLHIPGEHNIMADTSSRAFKTRKYFAAHTNLKLYFNTHFPQYESWNEYQHLPAWFIASDIITAWNTIASGVTPKTSQERHKYWGHRSSYYKNLKIDPTLQQGTRLQSIIAATAFGTRVGKAAMVSDVESKFLPSLLPFQTSLPPEGRRIHQT